ncbi:MAG: TrkH family potassium uptake protein [Actinomycetota bacterium]|nr:TrkH family potassium uptake protein [Actinomycetota bacterium]
MATAARTLRSLRPGSLGVDLGSALDLVGGVLKYVGFAFLVPAAVAVGYGEPSWPFLLAGAFTAAVGWALDRATGTKTGELVGPREGFLVVALTWLLVPAFGCLPFLLADVPQLSNPVDAYFEAVSGFTASGATVLTDVEALDRSMLLWRQLSHWLGGMGIIILAVAVLPRLRIGGRQLLQSELAGPTDLERMSATIRDTARRLWVLYVGLTAVAVVLLTGLGWTGIDPEMDLYDAVGHAFSVMALGGFSTQTDSIAGYAPQTQWLLVLFMVLAGVNFLRLYRIFVQRQARVAARDEELRLYAAFLVGASLLVTVEVLAGGFLEGGDGIRHAVFQTVSIMTTTGFATSDYTEWGALAGMTLLALMFVGASAGSTGGSIKVVRHLLIGKVVRRELRQAVHREAVVPIRLSGGVVDERALRSATAFVLLYLAVFALGAIGLVVDARRVDAEIAAFEAIGAAAACLGNVGPAFGFAGPFGSYEPFSDLSTGILAVLMWLGRLEIVPVVVLLMRSYWRP